MIPFDSESLALILFFYIIICKLELYTDGSARQFSWLIWKKILTGWGIWQGANPLCKGTIYKHPFWVDFDQSQWCYIDTKSPI